ncbi:MAG: type II secretion system F family protein [Ignavibacteriae bacterium]|nr:type II secretion system F family protein [Ignavibacteriota bacterium]NOH00191.1 type II secretion system F family protein [Ignavibacteriota bacterium]
MLNSITHKDIIEFNKTMSLLLISKISITQALEILIEQIKNTNFQQIIKKVLNDVTRGKTLSNSFSKYPKLFPPIYIANIKIGEETGNIARVVSDYTTYLEKNQNLIRDLKKAARYPILVLLVSMAVITFMVFFLIPTFQNLFSSTKVSLPFVTQLIIDLSRFIENHLIWLILILGALTSIIFKSKDSIAFKNIIDRLLLRTPLVSKLIIKNLMARFALSMSILLKSRITLLEALKIARNTSSNHIFKKEVDTVIKRIIKGESLSANTSTSILFDKTFSRLLFAGEQTAELDKVFGMISDYYGKEFEYQLDVITSLIEPILILVIGVIVAIILIAMYLPMFDLINYFGV